MLLLLYKKIGGKTIKKKYISLLILAIISFNLVSCFKKDVTSNNSNNESTEISSEILDEKNDEDSNLLTVEDADTYINLNDNISIDGDGAVVSNNIVTINSAGIYCISGTLKDGQIIINCDDSEKVQILFNGVNISSSKNSPFYVLNADKTIITLIEGTENILSDASTYTFDSEDTQEPNATLFSKDDLTIKGNGNLTVNGNFNNGIQSKDDLKITGGNITVTSKNDGIKGKDSVIIKNGNITINSDGDGIRSTNSTDTEKGYIAIYGGTINITAGQDGIQAETTSYISDGTINITSGGGSENSSTKNNSNNWGIWGRNNTSSTSSNDDTSSAKGIKATTNITIEGGNININSSDDSLHSNDSLDINGGTIEISSGDDGIHSDSTLNITNGNINISKSYEGIESSNIDISGGTISLKASDDGLNAGGGNDNSSINGRPSQNTFSSTSSSTINISNGYIYIDADGDGIDSNGSVNITGGTTIVNGPSASGNGALDYDNEFKLTGGVLVAAATSGMLQLPSDSSTQPIVNLYLTSQTAGTLVNISDENGNSILSFAPAKDFSSVIISSPDIKDNKTYTASIGGTSNGTDANGLFIGDI